MNAQAAAHIPLSDWSALAVTGADAEHFLQGQITSDLRRLTADHAQLAAWCEPDGRVAFTFIVVRKDTGGMLLLVPCDRGDALANHLRKFVLRAAVHIQPDADVRILGRIQALAESKVPRLAVRTESEGRSINLDDGQHWLALRADQAIEAAPPEAIAAWHLAEVLGGLPWLPEALAGEFLPQMLNLDLLDQLSFDKGCFRGQEVIARLQHRGSVKRRLGLFEVASARPPATAERLYRAADSSGQPAGLVLAAAPVAPHHYALLAIVTIEPDARLRLGQDGPALERRAFPYPDDSRVTGAD